MRWAMTRRSAGLRVEGVIRALREAQHALLPHIGGHVAGEGDGGVLAGHDDERGLGRMGEAAATRKGRAEAATPKVASSPASSFPQNASRQPDFSKVKASESMSTVVSFPVGQTAKAARAGGRRPG